MDKIYPQVNTMTGGNYLVGGDNIIMGLDGSQFNMSYQLKRDGINVGSAISGTGIALNFNTQPLVGTYTINATNPSTGCVTTMNGSKWIPSLTNSSTYIECISPSSEGMALVKAVERQPSLANGIPSVDLPIYQVPSSPVTLSLEYNTSGLIVDELPTITGLGWRLETGGMITRVVIGLPDDLPNYGYLNRDTTINNLSERKLDEYTSNDFDYLINTLSINNYDDNPDIFYYDVLGVKGKFILGRDGKVYCFPKNNIKFSYTKEVDGTIKRIWAKLPNGSSIYFDYKELASMELLGASTSFISSWFPSKIESNDRIIISYNYSSSYQYSMIRNAYDLLEVNEFGVGTLSPKSYTISFNTPRIDSMSTATARVKMIYHNFTNIGDLVTIATGSSWPLLKEVNIYLSPLSNDQFLTKSYSYELDYLALNRTIPVRSEFMMTKYSKCASGVKLPYILGYFSLSNNTSKAMDLWGYSNGAVGNTSIIPSIYSINGKLTWLTAGTLEKSGANRNAVFESCQAGNLNFIINPDGLKTEFEYELNQFTYEGITISGNGLRIKEIIRKDSDFNNLLESTQYEYYTEGSSSITSGRLLYHSIPAIGLYGQANPLSSLATPKQYLVKASYHGSGNTPYASQSMYSKITVKRSGAGYTSYYFDHPIERGNNSIIPTSLSWIINQSNDRLIQSNRGLLYLRNNSDPSAVSIFPFWNTPLLTKVIDYNDNNNKVKEVNHSYSALQNEHFVSGFKFLPVSCVAQGSLQNPLMYYYATKQYFLSAWRELVSTTETVYPLEGSLGTTLIQKKTYIKADDGLDFNFVKRIETGTLNESVINKFKYCFESEFTPPLAPNTQQLLDDLRAQLESNLNTCPTPKPTLLGNERNECMQNYYDQYESQLALMSITTIDPIYLLRLNGEYSRPLVEINMLNRMGHKTITGVNFSYIIVKNSCIVLPINDYALVKPVDSALFVIPYPDPVYLEGYDLVFNSDQCKPVKTYRYDFLGRMIEYYGEDNIKHAISWSENGMYPEVEGTNCTYENIVGKYGDELRISNPGKPIIERKYLFPYGKISETDSRGRTTYYIYNSLGEVVAIRDHEKNVRRFNINRRKRQEGSSKVVPATDPYWDFNLITEGFDVPPLSVTKSCTYVSKGSSQVLHPEDPSINGTFDWLYLNVYSELGNGYFKFTWSVTFTEKGTSIPIQLPDEVKDSSFGGG
ncbi:MAG: hypothetical protein AB9846_17950 [Tenuifilaceae bacterium]